jgi:hypothetical protein
MKKKTIPVFVLLLLAATVLVAGIRTSAPQISASREPVTNAAFRDGMFAANYDMAQGRILHLSSGRWSTDADRASFIAGYHQALRQNHPEALAKLTASELAAYREGLNEGLRHRRTAQPFQVDKTASYRAASANEREAYASGYQLGYYTQRDFATNQELQASIQLARK